ncbi:hypothetical protein EBU94_09330 [bacterium]|nr:hypothetical protein [bacterium]
MSTTLIIFISLVIAGSAIALLLKKKKPTIKEPIVPTQTLDFDNPPIKIDTKEPQVTPEPEMPIKPPPVNCQKAQFMPAPQEFFYTDCCGKTQMGMGFEPWEKRAPVGIDANQEFVGMELIGEESSIDC